MVSKEQSIKLILDLFPSFQANWEEHLLYWDGEDPGLCLNMAEFSYFIRDLIVKNDVSNKNVIKLAFELIEKFMVEGDDEVKEAAATCFLENMINAVSWGRIPASGFVHLLGEESKKYCKAWDEFTGVKTEGLWDRGGRGCSRFWMQLALLTSGALS